jgi:ribosomal protein S18 acetylase RimI-like enzyme
MLIANSPVDKPDTPPSEDHLRLLLGMLGEQIDQNTRLAVAEDGTIAAAAMLFIPAGEEQRVALIEGMVQVNHRGRGMGGYLLRWMEARVRQAFSKSDDGRPQIIRTSCAVHQVDRIRLFEGQGFTAMRYSYKMRRSLSKPILKEPLPESLKWAQWTSQLDLPLMHAFNEAFREHYGVQKMNEELWRQLFTGVPQFRGDLTYLAMEADAIVGFCINWLEENEGADNGSQEGWVEAIGVIPAWRGRGVASALLGHALQLFQAEGLERAALEVDAQNPTGALRLYEKHGFEVARETIHFVKQLN